FQRPFVDFALATRMPRDEFLRGRFIYLGKPSGQAQSLRPFDITEEGREAAAAAAVAKSEGRDQLRGSRAEDEARKASSTQTQPEALDRARMPRDLLLHGRLDEATVLLVAMRDQLRGQRERLGKVPDLGKRLVEWREKMIEAQADYLRAGEPARRK